MLRYQLHKNAYFRTVVQRLATIRRFVHSPVIEKSVQQRNGNSTLDVLSVITVDKHCNGLHQDSRPSLIGRGLPVTGTAYRFSSMAAGECYP